MSRDTSARGDERGGGLAAERTELAWGRSALALLGCGAAVARGAPQVTGNLGRPAVGIALLALAGLVWLSGVPYARDRALATRQRRRQPALARDLAVMAIGTAAVGIAGVVIGAFLPG